MKLQLQFIYHDICVIVFLYFSGAQNNSDFIYRLSLKSPSHVSYVFMFVLRIEAHSH